MRQLLFLATLLIVLVGGFVLYTSNQAFAAKINTLLYQSPCDTPLRYHVGQIDSRFQLSSDAVQNDLLEAAGIWEKVYGKKLFVYDPKGQVTVNLVYDTRQAISSKITDLSGQLQNEKSALQPKIQEYEALATDFKSRLAKLNGDIDYWNTHGGAPPNIYDQLTQEQQSLQDEANKLNAMGRELNKSTDAFNVQVGELNQDVHTFNAALSQKPEEGLYNPNDNTITLYFNNSKDELVHTLAHEMGHAIGMNHVVDEQAIMYPMTSENIVPTNADIAELDRTCQKESVVRLYALRLQNFMRDLSRKIQSAHGVAAH